MAKTTTIRVDVDTHARLTELSKLSGSSLTDTVKAATEALRRLRFAEQTATDLDRLRAGPDAWARYITEAEETAVTDGLS